MGWKTLQDRFEINNHIVQVGRGEIYIGSGYVHDLVRIKMDSGELRENRTFRGFLYDAYPKLAEATADEILEAINEEDSFSDSIPVYTYRDGEILEKYCERPGWPYVTHDGCVMYENTFSTNKAEVVAWAKRSAERTVEVSDDQIDRLKSQLKEWEQRKQEALDSRLQLDRDYPDIKGA